jgi:hypothetical protein
MKKPAVNPGLLHLLVSVYNQSIQTYHYFPEVIICGCQRLEREAFDHLVAQNFVQAYRADSFGSYYRLSKKGEEFLFQCSFRRKAKHPVQNVPVLQHSLPFFDVC